MLFDRRRCSLQTLLKSGFSPTLESINRFMLFLLRLQKFDFIVHFFSQLNSNRIEGNRGAHSVFTWALLKSHKFDDAEQVIKNRITGSTRMWDALIQGFSITREDPERAFSLLEDCLRNRDVLPSSFTFGSIIHRLSSQGNMGKVIEVLELMADAKVKYPFDNFICSSVISGFCKIGKPELALGFFKNATSSGALQPDVVTYTALVSALGKLGDVNKATGYLAKMLKDGQEPTNVTYTAIMAAYCLKGKLEEALTVFKNINALGIEADEFMFATLINGFSHRGDFENVFHLLDEMEKMGVSASIVTYNTVINGLCKFGRMSEADEFSKVVPADIITYSTLLHGYAKEESIPGILQTKKQLEAAQISMDVVMCNVLIKAQFVLEAFEDAYAVYRWMPEMDLTPNAITFCTMIDGYCKVGKIDEALEIFDESRKTSITSHACYNAMINGLCKKGIVEIATEVFIELNDKGLVLDTGIYRMLMQSIFKEKYAKEALELIYRMEALGPNKYNTICNDSILLLCERGLIEDAYELFMMMRMKGSSITGKSFFSLLRSLISDGKLEKSLPLLSSFIKEYGLNEPRVHKIVAQYLCWRNVDCAFSFLAKTTDNSSATPFPVSLLKVFIKEGRALDAYRLIMEGQDYLPAMDVVDYSTVIDGLCKGGCVSEALDLCMFAEKKGITLNIVSYNSIINGLCIDGRLIEAFRLFDSLEKIGLTPSEITYATLIYALCRDGYLSDAKHIFRKMVLKGFQPKLQVYNSLLDGFSKIGQLEEVLDILDDMESKHIQPDYFTVSAVINCYCQKGDLVEALAFFDKFKSKDILPDFLGFLYLIRGLCSKGRMEEARSILREMLQIKPIAELVDVIDSEVETESMSDCLVFLCEKGRIQEALKVLNDIASILFGARRLSTSNQLSRKQQKVYEGKSFGSVLSRSVPSSHEIDLDVGSCDDVNGSSAFTTKESHMARSQSLDFDSYYSGIAALCSKGELQEASQLAKQLLSDLAGSPS